MGLFSGGFGADKPYGGGWGSGPSQHPGAGGGVGGAGFNPSALAQRLRTFGGREFQRPQSFGHQMTPNQGAVLPPVNYAAANPKLMDFANMIAQFYGLGGIK